MLKKFKKIKLKCGCKVTVDEDYEIVNHSLCDNSVYDGRCDFMKFLHKNKKQREAYETNTDILRDRKFSIRYYCELEKCINLSVPYSTINMDSLDFIIDHIEQLENRTDFYIVKIEILKKY